MARSTGQNTSVWLDRLERAVIEAKKLKRGAVMSSTPMAELIGVSWPVLRGWCRDIPEFAASGAFLSGAQGSNYEFKARDTIKFLLRHFKAIMAGEEKRGRDIARRTGVKLPDGEQHLSLDDTRKQVDLTMTVTAAADKQGRTCDAKQVESLLRRCFQGWSVSVMSIETEMDPNGNLSPAAREELNRLLRLKCAQGRDGVEKELREFRAHTQQEATGRAG